MKAPYLASALLLILWSTPGHSGEHILITQHGIAMTESYAKAGTPMAVAIEDGIITWVGEPAAAHKRAGEDTQITDLGGQALLPGFIDAHGHASFTALTTTLANVSSPPVGEVIDIPSLQQTLKNYIASNKIPPGEWVIGMGYDDSLLAKKQHPNRQELDAVSTEHPIYLIHVSGHLGAANSKALARAGITSESPNPPGGIIRRIPHSQEPNGVLEESANYPVRKYLGAANKNPLASITAAMQLYASHGITTAQDGATSFEAMQLLQAAAQQGLLTLDTVIYPTAPVYGNQQVDESAIGNYQQGLKLGGVKLMLDGSPQGKTAYLTKPYHHPPHGQDESYRGYPSLPPAQIDELVKNFLDKNIPIIAHANGDAAADILIDAVGAAAPQHDHRTVMIHAQTVREDQLTKMKSLSMVPSYFSAHTFFWGDWHRDSVLGDERASRISPTASTVARGMPFTVHNDAPVVPPNMLRLLWATTNRLTRSGKVLGEAQRISIYHALQAVTIFAAYQNFEEQIKGTIEVGKQADLVVLSKDPLQTPAENLLDLEVVKTFARGKLVYSNAQ